MTRPRTQVLLVLEAEDLSRVHAQLRERGAPLARVSAFARLAVQLALDVLEHVPEDADFAPDLVGFRELAARGAGVRP